jgi:hypothetical protein
VSDQQPPERFNHEGDWIVRQMFSDADLRMSPEEYAARHAHEWGCFSYHLYRYADPALGAWVRRLGEILFNGDELERCRRLHFTPEEYEAVLRRAAEDF